MTDFSNVPCSGNIGYVEILNWKQAKSYLDGCAMCPLRMKCLETVQPDKHWSDGVVGGYLWLNGKPMIKEYERIDPLDRPYADTETLTAYMNRKNNDE